MNGAEFIEGVKCKLADEGSGNVIDRQIAERLGLTVQALKNWRGWKHWTRYEMVGLSQKYRMPSNNGVERDVLHLYAVPHTPHAER